MNKPWSMEDVATLKNAVDEANITPAEAMEFIRAFGKLRAKMEWIKTVKRNTPKVKEPITLTFSGSLLKIPTKNHEAFVKAFPLIDLNRAYLAMDAWLLAHPERNIRKYPQFANNWLRNTKTEDFFPETVKKLEGRCSKGLNDNQECYYFTETCRYESICKATKIRY